MKQFLRSLLFLGKRDAKYGYKVIVTENSQNYKLVQQMNDSGLTHGETVVANLKNVRLAHEGGQAVLYFCPIKNLTIAQRQTKGDGKPIPEAVALKGFMPVAASTIEELNGHYDLQNVLLTSNGKITLSATDKTKWRKRKVALA